MDQHTATAATPLHVSPWNNAPAPESVAVVADALLQLHGLERLVMSLYYAEGLRLPEIALVLELSELEVAQVYAQAFATLRARTQPAQRQAA